MTETVGELAILLILKLASENKVLTGIRSTNAAASTVRVSTRWVRPPPGPAGA